MKNVFTDDEYESFARIIPWAETYFWLTEGQFSGEKIRFARSPWLRLPLLSFEAYNVAETTILKSTQSAGTTAGEICFAYQAAQRPENMLFQALQKEKARQQADRTLAKMRRVPAIQSGLDYDHVMQMGGSLPDWFALFQAANDATAQSTTAGVQINDEVWQWPAGMLQQFRNRTDQLTFKKIVNITSAGDSASDAMAAFQRGNQGEFHLRCVGCDELFWPLFGRRAMEYYTRYVVIWDGEEDPVRMRCPHCDHEHFDRRADRDELTLRGDYVSQNPTPVEYTESFRWNAFVPPWVRWNDLRNRYLAAKADIREGKGKENMRIFIITRLVESEEDVSPDVGKMEVTGDYKLNIATDVKWANDFVVAEEWTRDGKVVPELARFLSVDVGQDHFFAVARAVDPFFRTRLVSAMKLYQWEQVYQMSRFLAIPPHCVGVDCGTMTKRFQRVYHHIAQFGFWGFEGADQDRGFLWRFKNDEDEEVSVYRAYSQPIERGVMVDDEAITFRVIRFSNWLAKNRFVDLRDGKAEYWGVPWNHSIIPGKPERAQYESEYHHQCHGETIEEQMNKTTRKIRKIWISRHANHYGDCEINNAVFIQMLRDDPDIEAKRAPLIAAA
jgi:hypothetical protein